MKKLSCFVLAAIMSLSLAALTACNNDTPKDTDAAGTNAGIDHVTTSAGDSITVPDVKLTYPAATLYTSYEKADGSAEKTPTNANLASWFCESVEFDDNFNTLPPAGIAFVGEYVLRIPSGRSAVEVDIFKISDTANTEAVTAMATTRKTIVNNSDIRLYDTTADELLKTAQVVTVGDFVLYICTANTEVSVLRAKAFLQTKPDCTALELYNAVVLPAEVAE